LNGVATVLYYHHVERRWGVREFDWDEANEDHIARHGVTPGEVEEVFYGRVYVKRAGDRRYTVLGHTGAGRLLMVVVVRFGGGLVRAITARDMIERERRLYSRRRK
jgi:uncharacterized DUF497 family protein